MFKDYFTFTQGQTRAIIFLLICIVCCSILYLLLPAFLRQPIKPDQQEVERLLASIKFDEPEDNFAETSNTKLTPFPFDPNTLDSAGFRQLGLRPKLVHTILNYRNKGGHFYRKEGLQKIYGLQPNEYEQLESFINIAQPNDQKGYAQPDAIVIELNSADTGALVKLRGIGSRLSMNIIQYRTQLGGYATVTQIKEVYGIKQETFDAIRGSLRVNVSKIKKINLNEATFAEISQHPYLRGDVGKAIVDYRKKKGYHLEDIGQLKEIELINEELFRKIAPYITVQ